MRVQYSLLLAITACVTTSEAPPDEPPPSIQPGALGGASSPTGTQAAVGACDYSELHDSTNDYRAASGYSLESTGLTFSGTALSICGQLDSGHFDASDYAIDIDTYGLTLSADADVIVHLTGSLQTVSTVGVWAYNSTTSTTAGGGYFIYNQGVFSGHLPAGAYELSVEAYDNQGIAAPLAYTISIASDSPSTRCPSSTGAANYTEANDGSSSVGNDMIAIDYSSWPYESLTASTTDAPEQMTSQLVSGASYLIQGDSALIAPVDSYNDRDTYSIQTDSTTNQLAVRVDWAGTTADLDYYLFAEGGTFPIASSATAQNGGGEFATFAVSPNSRYWLWVGAYNTSTTDTPYNVTLCAATFTP
ncbi:MAG: hypothetical protein ACM31C_09690 [Acidobacteriota bacterium]